MHACHQNHAPIFSRPTVGETNANPGVAGALERADARLSGIADASRRGYAERDRRSHRSRQPIGVMQRIWRDACDASCRAIALTAALQYRGSGERAFETESLAKEIAPAFAARWPAAWRYPIRTFPIAIHSPNCGGTGVAEHRAGVRTLAPRAPLEIWTADDALLARRFVLGLAIMIPDRDVRESTLPCDVWRPPIRTSTRRWCGRQLPKPHDRARLSTARRSWHR